MNGPALRIPRHWEVYRRELNGDRGDARNGLFQFPKRGVTVMVGTGAGWEHASLSRADRLPDWTDMCWLRAELWHPEAAVMQLHPPASTYVNRHPYCLHLWRPLAGEIPLPPPWMVG